MLTLDLDRPLPGDDVERIIEDLIHIAKTLHLQAKVTFNGIELTARPYSTGKELLNEYSLGRTEQSKKYAEASAAEIDVSPHMGFPTGKQLQELYGAAREYAITLGASSDGRLANALRACSDKLADPEPAKKDAEASAADSPIASFDDGSFVKLGSWSGGASGLGAWGEHSLVFTDPDGNETTRRYRATDLGEAKKEASAAKQSEEKRWQEPDWKCPNCGFANFGIRTKCRNYLCGYLRPLTEAPGAVGPWPKIEPYGVNWALWLHPLAEPKFFDTERDAKEYVRGMAQRMSSYVPPLATAKHQSRSATDMTCIFCGETDWRAPCSRQSQHSRVPEPSSETSSIPKKDPDVSS